MLALTMALTLGEALMPVRVTIADIAREAGVSMMTVSRVVNDKEGVSQETRQAIEEVIRRLDYHPNIHARGLATQSTSTFGLVVPDISNPFFSGVARGVEKTAYAKGYSILVCDTEEDPQRELDVLELLLEKWVDGLVLCSTRLEQHKLQSILAHYPAAVLINNQLEVQDPSIIIGSAMIDDKAGGQMATNHLIKSGHTVIGFLAGPAISQSGRWRNSGYRQALIDGGLPYRPELVLPCFPTVEGGHQAASQLLNSHPEITAMFCFNDLVAVGAIQAAHEIGRKIPDDLAIVGYDDIMLAALVTPSLTTCHIDREELGKSATNLLVERLAGCTKECEKSILQPELIIRVSAP
jgi:LacI family transcriptional regulator